MRHFTPQISWHSQDAILSAHFQSNQTGDDLYRIVTAGVDRDMRIWRLEFDDANNRMHAHFISNLRNKTNAAAINIARFSPDGVTLAAGDVDGELVLWRRDEQHQRAPDIFKEADEDDLPPNKEIWRTVRCRISQCKGSTKDITDLAWSSDSALLCVLSLDDSAVLYNVKDDSRIETLRCFRQFANGVCFDPLNRYIVTIGNERDMKIFSVTPMPASFAKKARSKTDMNDMHPARLLKRVCKARLPLPLAPAENNNATVQGEMLDVRLFHDDQLTAFSRKLCFSPCGELLFVPAGAIEHGKTTTYATYVFTASSHFAAPALVFTTPTATIGCACSPVLYELHQGVPNALGLPYRCVFAALGAHSITLFDTQFTHCAIAVVSNIHIALLCDIAWSPDGRALMVASQDGYLSFLRFDANELGRRVDMTPPMTNVPTLQQYLIEQQAPTARTPKTPRVPKTRNASGGVKVSTPGAAPKPAIKPITLFFKRVNDASTGSAKRACSPKDDGLIPIAEHIPADTLNAPPPPAPTVVAQPAAGNQSKRRAVLMRCD